MVFFEGDVAEYYAWFIKKRYNLILNKPLRGAHISFINDSTPKTNDEHWWLNIPHEEREQLQSIREELGLGRPYFGMHMSIGYVNEKNLPHSKYIHDLIKKGFIKFA